MLVACPAAGVSTLRLEAEAVRGAITPAGTRSLCDRAEVMYLSFDMFFMIILIAEITADDSKLDKVPQCFLPATGLVWL